MKCKKPLSIGVWQVGCGQCLPCRINKRRLWTHRLVIEGEQHQEKCFVTLTYSDQSLPVGGTLVPPDFKNFIKRLRRKVEPKKIRYYGVGEYGEENQRPHYHAIIFGVGPCPFRKKGFVQKTECKCSQCSLIRSVWSGEDGVLGRIDVAPFEEGVANYVAKYVTKKLTRKNDPRLKGRHPEFARMSLKPGIGADGASYFGSQLLSKKKFVLDEYGDVPTAVSYGKKMRPLGAYLRSKIRKELGVEKEVCMQKKALALYEEKDALHTVLKGKELWDYEQKMRSEVIQASENLEAKFKIYENKGK